VIVDLSNIYRADEMKRVNFLYRTVGRAAAELFWKPPRRGGVKRLTPNP
jgi:hypothetical protein